MIWKPYYQKPSKDSRNPHQNSNNILPRNRKYNPKIYMETQKTLNSWSNSEKKSNARSITIPDFKLYYTEIVIKTENSSGTKRDTQTKGIE
jgi:hypothetical protein